MTTPVRYCSDDLENLPDVPGVRYEIIDGELHVSKQPQWHHQRACGRVFMALELWSTETGLGEANGAPGVIFAPDDDVAPDGVWMSRDRLNASLDSAGHVREAPELIVEVLSPGAVNEQRDREKKLALYSRRGVEEYWILDWRRRGVEGFRRRGEALRREATLGDGDVLTSPLLPGFSCRVATFWDSMVRPPR